MTRKKEKYEKLADKIYDLITDEKVTYGDILASLELCRLWVYSDFHDLHEEHKTVNTVEVNESKEDS
jgi:hypothetical protein